jgi:hypothetical protein
MMIFVFASVKNSDIKNSNKHHRNEKLNRSLQNFMYGVISDDNEAAAKKSLAVCTELWRRHVWRDARTVNVIGEDIMQSDSISAILNTSICQGFNSQM